MTALKTIHRNIISCDQCPRLRKYCRDIAKTKRRSYQNENYWGKPIPGFGDPKARLVIVGLAPAAHGANRTGRIFTGDRSGEWLYRALHRAGFANQSSFERANDGLVLQDTYVTCVVKCAPPANKPHPKEMLRCGSFLEQELSQLKQSEVFLVLGQIGLNGLWPHLKKRYALTQSKPRFGHGQEAPITSADPGIPSKTLLMSYHPSQQNTFTGRLTIPMFDSIFSRARELLTS
jgi:uracil-DNA glycosylase family 4